jgi:hypothetical protein
MFSECDYRTGKAYQGIVRPRRRPSAVESALDPGSAWTPDAGF